MKKQLLLLLCLLCCVVAVEGEDRRATADARMPYLADGVIDTTDCETGGLLPTDGRTKQCAGNLPDGTSFMVSCPANGKCRWPLVLQLSRDGKAFCEQ